MSKFLANLNKWIRKLHRWMVIPIIVILLSSILLRETSVSNFFQRLQQFSIIFMAVSGLFLYLYRQWLVWQRKARSK